MGRNVRTSKSNIETPGREKSESSKESPKNTDSDSDQEENTFEVEKIVGDRIHKGKHQYKIRWIDHSSHDDTWENESQLDCEDLIIAYVEKKDELNGKIDEAKEGVGKKRSSTKGRTENEKGQGSESSDENEESPKKKKFEKGAQSTSNKKTSKKGKKKEESDIDEDEDKNVRKDSQLSKKKGDSQLSEKKDESESDEGQEEYEVERIIDVKLFKNGSRKFLVKWKGYSAKESTWEREEKLQDTDALKKYLYKIDEAKNTVERELRQVRKHTKPYTMSTNDSGRRLSKRNSQKDRAVYYDCD